MTGKAYALCLVLMAPLAGAPATAQDAEADAIVKQIINVPSPRAFSVQGMKAPPKARKDATVQLVAAPA